MPLAWLEVINETMVSYAYFLPEKSDRLPSQPSQVAHGRAILPSHDAFESDGTPPGILQKLWGAGTRCIFFDLTYMHARRLRESLERRQLMMAAVQ